jgi:hypothetical protein
LATLNEAEITKLWNIKRKYEEGKLSDNKTEEGRKRERGEGEQG